MAGIDSGVLARLRRVFDDGHTEPAALAEAIVQMYAAALHAGDALRLERWMACVAGAAEELGQDAEPEAILARAHQLEEKLN